MFSKGLEKHKPVWLGIFVFAVLSRVIAITVPINIDETWWLHRSEEFISHLASGNLEGTYLRHHPGVTNMWVIGAGHALRDMLLRFSDGNLLPLPFCVDASTCPLSAWIIIRVVQAIVTSVCMVGIFVLARQLFGQQIALFAMIIVLLEPFFLAYQRFITTDALQADFTTLALLFFLRHLQRTGDRRRLVASGICMGLATAAKIPALFVLPAIGTWIVLIELNMWPDRFPRRGWLRQGIDLALWGFIIGVTIFVVWPALWVAPLETLRRLYEGLARESGRGNFFFLGEHTDAPGPLFYPLVLAFRLSPVLQFGILAGLGAMLFSRSRPVEVKQADLIALGLVPLVVLMLFSVLQNKIDRYILLIIPELALFAAIGWQAIIKWIAHQRHRKRSDVKGRGYITAIVLALAQLCILVPCYPYYIAYYNPLFGGIRVAQHIFMIGQGEGLDQAAQWLNRSSNAENMSVCSWYPGTFQSYFEGHTIEMCWVDEPERCLPRAHRVTVYVNQRQRQLPTPEALAYFASQEPLYTVQIQGLEYVHVYPGPLALAEDVEQTQVPLSVNIGSEFQIVGYDLSSPEVGPGDELRITLYWKLLETPPQNGRMTISLLDDNGQPLVHDSATGLLNGFIPFSQVPRDSVMRDVRILNLNPKIPPGSYPMAIAWSWEDASMKETQTVIGELNIEY